MSTTSFAILGGESDGVMSLALPTVTKTTRLLSPKTTPMLHCLVQVADPLRHFVDGLLSLTNPIGSVGDKVNVGIFRCGCWGGGGQAQPGWPSTPHTHPLPLVWQTSFVLWVPVGRLAFSWLERQNMGSGCSRSAACPLPRLPGSVHQLQPNMCCTPPIVPG